METLADTKLRVVREAVQDNVPGPRRIRRRPTELPRFPLPLCVAGAFLIASLVYLGLTPAAHSRASVASANARIAIASESPTPRRLDRSALPLSVKRIVVDAGHGGAQRGAVSDSGVAEKDITLDIALRLRRLLDESLFDVLMTRDTDQTLSLEQRVAFANTSRGDLFVSI